MGHPRDLGPEFQPGPRFHHRHHGRQCRGWRTTAAGPAINYFHATNVHVAVVHDPTGWRGQSRSPERSALVDQEYLLGPV